MKIKVNLLTVIFLIASAGSAFAQKNTLSGKIYDADSREPIYFASVNIKGTPIYDMSDENGYYMLEGIVPGDYTVYVSILGYQHIEREVSITKSAEDIDFYLNISSLALDEVVVTARVSQSKEGSTTYKIGNEAIQQIQPISVVDILQLIPGNKIGTASLNSRVQVNLRNAGGYESVNAFGTSVIIDGNQLSNDGNMQEGLNNVANKGVDLREISASNIESVEVISGVPSARYGNITSGTILINRKAGFSPLYASFNSTPTAYQGGLNKGYKLPGGGFLNTDIDYTYSNNKATSRRNYYQRINLGLRWTKEFSEARRWTNNMSFGYGNYFDGQRDDPDEVVLVAERESKNQSIRFSNNGSLKAFGKTNYSLSINYTDQYSLSIASEDGPVPIIESLEEGTFVTSFTPIQFYQTTEFFGAPLNINGRFDTDQSFSFLKLNHNTNIGFEYSFNKNYGRGRVIDDENNTASSGAGVRAMNFYNVPATEIYSAYLQDNINIKRGKSLYFMNLGLRYDYMLRKYHLLSPRLSFSAKYFEKLRIRLAYGVSYKSPSMLQLYPGPKYFDIINLNHYSEDNDRSLAVVTTHIYQPTNDHLKPAKGITLEGGFDYEQDDLTIRVTGYYKEINRGLSTGEMLQSFRKTIWEVTGEDPNGIPVVAPTDSSLYVSTKMNYYANTLDTKTVGVELTTQFPRIEATHTTINLSGSYLKTNTLKTDKNIASSTSLTGAQKSRYGVYDNPSYNTHTCRSNLTIIQHIPQIKLLFTLVAEANWVYKHGVADIPGQYPIAYYENDGTYVEIPEEERSGDQYADLIYSPDYYQSVPVPSYFNFHLQVRKETEQGHSFSFYANNFLWYNPSYVDEITKTRTFLNSRITFGFGMNFKI